MYRTSATTQNNRSRIKSAPNGLPKWLTTVVMISLVGFGLLVLLARTSPVKSKAAITVQAAGRGKPYLNFQDGQRMVIDYRGDGNLTQVLRSGQAQARSVASADLDGNATPDLVVGYAYRGMGIITIQRGNPDAFAPKDDSVFVRMQQGYNPDALLPQAETYQVPEPVDFVLAGDFNHDNRKDVLVGTRGGDLFLLAGDGQGGLSAPEQISLPGTVTAMATGEFRVFDGQPDVAVAVNGPNGPKLLVYDGADGGVTSTPMEFALAGEASAVQFGQMDKDPFMDITVAAGSEIDIVHGWGRKFSPALQSQVERINAPSEVRGMALGHFIWDREGRNEIATLAGDGTVSVIQPDGLDTRPFSDSEVLARSRNNQQARTFTEDLEAVPGWKASSSESWTASRTVATSAVAGDAVPQSLLTSTNISFRETDDLLVAGGRSELNIVRQIDRQTDAKNASQAAALSTTGDMAEISLSSVDAPVAVLPLPQKLNGERSIVVLQSQSAQPTIVPLQPAATIVVDTTADNAALSACTGAANDCSLRGAITFANANAGTVITLPAGTYVLAINGSGGCDGNATGDLDINVNTTINGAGAATTIIRQSGTGGTGGDRVICMNVPGSLNIAISLSGLTITGGRDLTNVGGGGIVGGAQGNSLTLTNVTISNDQCTGAANHNGGGFSWTGGSVTLTSCLIGGTSAPGADRTNGNLANSDALSGGGLGWAPGSPFGGQAGATGILTITGTTFNHNTSASASAGGGGLDLFSFNTGTGSCTISGSTFTNNQATAQSGGGLIIESTIGTTIDTTSFTSNSASNKGGGIFHGGAGITLNLDGTSPSISFASNTAPGGGTSISTKGLTSLSGTNISIGGSIEVTTGGTWNSNGGTYNLTDVNVLGGAFNANSSTMTISGNLQVVPENPPGTPGASFDGGSGTVNLQGNLTVNGGGSTATVFTGNTGNFNFTGTTAQSITASSSPTFSFNNLTDSNTTQPLTANNSFAVGGNLNVNGANAIFDPVAAAVISGGGTLTGTGTARVRRTAATADFLSQYTITNKTLTNLTVEYIGAAAQIGSALTYGGLKINNASGVTLAAGTTTVNGTLTLTSGALAVGANTLVINNGSSVGAGSLTSGATGTVNYNQGSNGQSVLAGTYGNLTFSNFTKVLPNGTMGVAGTFTPGSGVGHTITGSTFDFNGAGAQTVPAFLYNNLTISQARTINTNVTMANGGTIGIAGTFSPTATFSGTGKFDVTNNTVDFNGSGAQTVPVFNFNNLTISGNRAVAITLGGGNIGVAGTFNPSVTGNTWVNTGNTVVFNGTATQTIPAFAFFNGLTLNNSTGASLGGGVTVGGALTLTSGALGVGTNTLTLNGAVSAPGGSLTSGATGTVNYNQGSNGQATVLAINYGNLTFSNFNKTLASSGTIGIAGTFTPGTGAAHTITGSTINFNGAGTQTIPGFTYNNLTSSGGAAARTLDAVNTIKIAGTFTPGTNVYTITGSTIEYNGSGASQTLPNTFTTYNNLTLNNTSGTTGFAGLTVNGLIEVKAGTFTSSSSYNNVQIDSGATLAGTAATTINVSGTWTNNGGAATSFTANSNTVNFNGSGAQTIGGSTVTTFNNLTIANAGTGVSLTQNATVNGLLTLTNDLTTGGSTLTMPASGTSGPASGAADVVGNVVRTGFVSAGNTLSFGNPFNTIHINSGSAPTQILVNLVKAAPVGFSGAVQRTYTITPTGASGPATVRLHYLDSELNGNTPESSLDLRRFNGTGWAPIVVTASSTGSANDNWLENNAVTNFSAWTFSTFSPTATNGVVSGRITDASGSPVAGAVINLNGTQSRKTITDASGNYHFDNVETDGFYTVTPSRANYNFSPTTRSFSQIGNKTEAAFTATSSGDSVTPLDTAEYFVRQQYVDVLGREPDESGFNYWSDQILACAGDALCVNTRRRDVAAAFFVAVEFQQSGSFIYDMYAGTLNRKPAFTEYSSDRQQVVGGATLDAAKTVFAQSFVQRSEFTTKYGSAMTAESFVDALIQSVQTSGVDLSGERANLISNYNSGANTVESRAAVVRAVADNATFKQAQYNPAFVLTEYFSYLRRDPDQGGYDFWVNVLTNGDKGNYRGMVCSFITSTEYQQRFSRVVSHSNSECAQ